MLRLPYLFRTMTHLALDAFILLRSNLRSRTVLAAENLVLRKQLALYRERHVKPTGRPGDAGGHGALGTRDRLEAGTHRSQARHADPLAPGRLAAVLALAVTTAWSSSYSTESPTTDRLDGSSESDVGRRADCQRTVAQARNRGLTTHRGTISRADAPTPRAHPSQLWSTFVRNHARAVRVCDFCIAITASFQLYTCSSCWRWARGGSRIGT
jgi:hypothetical protein